MSNDKPMAASPKEGARPAEPVTRTPVPPAKTPPAALAPGKVVPLFRRVDWLTFLITFAGVMIGYYLTLAPELTLEDSGELATGSFYAGIPHPPGYPVWTVYTWLWTVLVPIKNVAWRVALGEAAGGALAAGLLGLLVSRGSSMFIEGIEELKSMSGRWENSICMVSGFVAGMLLGYNGFMWSQSVIVEVYAFSVASLMAVMLFLLRWIYAPHQRRYLYLALFFHGISFTNHQTLIVAAIGIEVAIAAANFRMGRSLFLGNTIIYLAGLILSSKHLLTTLEANPSVFIIFNVVGVCSIGAYIWFCVLSRETFAEFCLDLSLAASVLLIASAFAYGMFALVVALIAIGLSIKFARDTWKLGNEWLAIIICGGCWIVGALFYFYMPLAGMTNPPMEWGYPRTVEGFIHAFTRGQYEKTNPTNIIGDPLRFLTQLQMLGTGIIEEFNWVYVFLALIPFLFFLKLHKRERAWMIGITAIYLCLGVLLLILLNPPPDRQAQQLVRVFFTASHTVIAMLVGYGIALVAAYMATHYERFRSWGFIGGGIAVALALYSFVTETQEVYFGADAHVKMGVLFNFVGHVFSTKDQYGLPVYAGLFLVAMGVIFVAALAVYRSRAPLLITLGLFALMPVHSILTHWSDNEQHEHWFGYWFGHDMFTPPFKGSDGKPLYPEMTKDAVLFGGTDPGRFCPTYMIFCDSFIPHNTQPIADQKFDRRDVYIITQNALADGTYLNYIRAQYNRSTQIDPPFFQELVRSSAERESNYTTNAVARMMMPLDNIFEGLGDRIEKKRRTSTSMFEDKDFADFSGFVSKIRAAGDPVSKFISDNLSADTKAKLSSGGESAGLKSGLQRDLNTLLERELDARKQVAAKQAARQKASESGNTKKTQELDREIAELSKVEPLYTTNRFQGVQLSEYIRDFIGENPQGHTRIRLNRLLLEEAYPKEIAKSLGGVYPDREIYTPNPEDSQKCFNEYLQDAQRRLQLNQLKPGEDVRVVDNRVQVSGQVAVMAINGLLTKVIFDHNPKNEFFVEESFPLDWMYPYLTPFGVIMKINRNTLPELSEDVIKKDHEFWSQFSGRLIGNWITYDTSMQEIADFVEKVYLRRDFTGFKGDRKFVRDDQAQKAFSKLRSSIGGVYAWRISDPNNHNPATQQRMIREADFAFRQALAFCPYSPEAVFRYVNLLLSLQKVDDALLVAETCLKLDPFNAQIIDLVDRLRKYKSGRADVTPAQKSLVEAEAAYQRNPSNLQNAFNLAGAYLQAGQTPRAQQILDGVLNDPRAEAGAYRALLQAYTTMSDTSRLQTVVQKLETKTHSSPSNLEDQVILAEAYRTVQQKDKATQTLDQVMNNPKLDPNVLLHAAQEYAAMMNYAKLESALQKLTTMVPDSPEAWYDLAALKATLGAPKDALPPLKTALDLSKKRHEKNPKERDLIAEVQKDNRLAAVRQLPEYKQIIPK